jgi:hypothetical protein
MFGCCSGSSAAAMRVMVLALANQQAIMISVEMLGVKWQST